MNGKEFDTIGTTNTVESKNKYFLDFMCCFYNSSNNCMPNVELSFDCLVSMYQISCSQIAEQAEFFSFGTNDLTQMTYGYSRDDIGKFLPFYLTKGILQNDPFEVVSATFSV